MNNGLSDDELRQALVDVHDGWIDAVNGKGWLKWEAAWGMIYPAIRDGRIKVTISEEGMLLSVLSEAMPNLETNWRTEDEPDA